MMLRLLRMGLLQAMGVVSAQVCMFDILDSRMSLERVSLGNLDPTTIPSFYPFFYSVSSHLKGHVFRVSFRKETRLRDSFPPFPRQPDTNLAPRLKTVIIIIMVFIMVGS